MRDSTHFSNLSELYASSAFCDCSSVNSYLKNHSIEETPEKYKFVEDIVEMMSRLRFKAEGNDFSVMAHSKRRALPLDIDSIAEELTDKDKNEAPIRIISIIAQKHLHMLKVLVENLHKILRRVRQKQNISSIQQIDSYCLQWLSRQSGYTVAEKAGNKQELLAVVRQESYFTLENKVLKDFLKKCLTIGSKYLKKYEKNFPNSQRIRAVKSLVSFSQLQLREPLMQSIANIYAMPTPNYTLQYNARYSKLWGLYRQLIQQMKIIELVWKKRHKLFYEYFYINFLSNFHILELKPSLFKTMFWISFMPQNARFIRNPHKLSLYEIKGFIFKIEYKDIEQNFIEIKLSQFDKNGTLIKEKSYVPIFLEDESISIKDTSYSYVFYCLSGKNNLNSISKFEDFDKIDNIIKADFEVLK